MEKERKTIKCSYALLVIILFATVCFLTDYILISRKMNKCNCPKCEVTDNREKEESKIINKNSDVGENQINSKQYAWDNTSFECSEKNDDYCLLANTKNKIEFYISNRIDKYNNNRIDQIKINGNVYNLNQGSFYSVKEDNSGNVFLMYAYDIRDNFVLLDSYANVVTNFEEFYDKSYDVNYVKYEDDKYIINSYPYSIAYGVAYCGYMNENDVFEREKVINYNNGKLEVIGDKNLTLKDVIENEKDVSGYASCKEYLDSKSN